jgi:hypothetical protein
MRKTYLPALAGLALCAAGVGAAETPAASDPTSSAPAVSAPDGLPLAPGFWDSRASAVVFSGHERRCLQAADILRYVHGWSNSIYSCTYPVSTVENGRVVWHGTCSSRGGRHLTIDAQGTYTATEFRARGRVASRLAGINLSAPFSMNARRLGECSQFAAEIARQQQAQRNRRR